MAVYNIPSFKDVDQFLQLIAAARGKLGKVCCQLTTDCSDSAVTTHDCVHCVMTLQLDCRHLVPGANDPRCGRGRVAQ